MGGEEGAAEHNVLVSRANIIDGYVVRFRHFRISNDQALTLGCSRLIRPKTQESALIGGYHKALYKKGRLIVLINLMYYRARLIG